MTATTFSDFTDVSAFSFVKDAFKGFRRARLRAVQRQHLLSVDDHTLRDMGLTHLDVLHGGF